MHARQRLTLGLLLGISLLLQGCKEEEITPQEHALLLTVTDLAPYLEGPHDEARAQVRKKAIPYVDAEELHYTFEYDKAANESPVFIDYNVKVSSKWLGGDSLAEEAGIDLGLSFSKLKREPLTDFPKYGDKSSMSLLTLEGKPIGNLFTVQYCRKSAMLMMSGIYTKQPAMWEEMMGKKLRLLKEFELESEANAQQPHT